MDLSGLSDVELVEESLRRVRDYPLWLAGVLAVDAEMRERGTERMRAAVETVGGRREAVRLAVLEVTP